jgi:hypothetical protein
MLVKDLQEFLAKFTEADATGTRQGNAVSNAVIFVEKDGRLENIRRIEVHEHASPIIGQASRHTAHRLVLKTEKTGLVLPENLKGDY